jgi:hypothetical protein
LRLLLGSAAALAAVSGAQAADAIVAAEPEPMEYVRVCDAFGTGYFYIPGTETCLKIGGLVRAELQLGESGVNTGFYPTAGDDDYYDMWGRFQLDVTAKNDTELGTLTSVASIRFDYGDNSSWDAVGTNTYINEAYIELGGFKIGRYFNWWDKGLNGESDRLDSTITTRMNSIAYIYTGDTFSAGIQVDELSRGNVFGPVPVFGAAAPLVQSGEQNVGLEALISTKIGGFAFDLLGSYDFAAEEGAIRALASAAVGPGTLQAAVVWSSGRGDDWRQAYYDRGEWALAASYAIKATDKLTLTPGATYIWDTQSSASGEYYGDDAWRAGLTLDYAITQGLNLKTHVHYNDVADDDFVDGFIRLDRTF